ncbi:MAG: glycine zipper 2TM domain-containing protein, partial [Proteobacteria bacterium]|nr:glycine zipper 2TM domain-containing protein [Pseudomonadota bacterium]
MKAVPRLMIMFPIAMLIVAPSVQAGSYYAHARVLESTPVFETVERAVPRQVCYDERVAPRRSRVGHSVTVPIVGAILGGALGNAVGHGKSNKRVGAVVGAVLGGS